MNVSQSQLSLKEMESRQRLKSDVEIEEDDTIEVQRFSWQSVLKMIRRQPLGTMGAIVIILMILMAVFADVITSYDPEESDLSAMLQPPNSNHWFGTDSFGRDLLTRVIYGARTALLVGFSASLLGAGIGLVLGVASAYFSGRIDLFIQRIIDILLSFPLIILAMAVVAVLGSGVQNVILAITPPFVALCARVVRSGALSVREMPYVDAARALGFSHFRIILWHMAPNVLAPFLIILTSFLGQAILLEASLTFLGLGVQEPTAAWGLMLQGGTEFAESAPWIAIFPGLAITLAVFAFNLFGDALRDILDPKLRSQ